MNLHKLYRYKKSISVSCFNDHDGDSNHTTNFILSTNCNNKVLKECAAQGVRYIFLTNRNLSIFNKIIVVFFFQSQLMSVRVTGAAAQD